MMVREFALWCDASGCKAKFSGIFAELVRKEAADIGWTCHDPPPDAVGSGRAKIDFCPTHQNGRCGVMRCGVMFMGCDPCVLQRGHEGDHKTKWHLENGK